MLPLLSCAGAFDRVEARLEDGTEALVRVEVTEAPYQFRIGGKPQDELFDNIAYAG